MAAELTLPFDQVSRGDIALVGGKNASIGELIQTLMPQGINVPAGFATTAHAYRLFLRSNGLEPIIAGYQAQYQSGSLTLEQVGAAIRSAILAGSWPKDTEQSICTAYRALCRDAGVDSLDVAVRSSATAEDLPDASFAGQQETFLNIQGEEALLL